MPRSKRYWEKWLLPRTRWQLCPTKRAYSKILNLTMNTQNLFWMANWDVPCSSNRPKFPTLTLRRVTRAKTTGSARVSPSYWNIRLRTLFIPSSTVQSTLSTFSHNLFKGKEKQPLWKYGLLSLFLSLTSGSQIAFGRMLSPFKRVTNAPLTTANFPGSNRLSRRRPRYRDLHHKEAGWRSVLRPIWRFGSQSRQAPTTSLLT